MSPLWAPLSAGVALMLWGCALGAVPQPRLTADPKPVSRAWPVMGTMLEISVWEADPRQARKALTAARAAVFRVDSLMSTYRPESELSTVNRRAGTDSLTRLSAETAAVLAAALEYARSSGGAFDVTVGPLVDVWGFNRPEGALPPPAALDSAGALVGWEQVEFDPDGPTVRLPRRGMRLDFGAIAKGYALDLAVAALRDAGVERGMVDLGGNLRVFGAPRADDWEIGLRDPRDPEAVIAVVRVDSGAVATSGDYERFFMHQGVRYSHILNPLTGFPARGVAGVSVIAPTGIASDALSTALFVLGPERGCDLARASGVEALWVLDGGARDGDLVATAGFPGDDSGGSPLRRCPVGAGAARAPLLGHPVTQPDLPVVVP